MENYKDNIKYSHTNIISKDYKKLANFYVENLNCKFINDINFDGDWIDKMTMLKNVKIKGCQLSLPGYDEGPTLEIFQYQDGDLNNIANKPNTQGYGHIAFLVNEIENVLNKIINNGGKQVGDLIIKDFGNKILKAVYLHDPENNIIELLNWKEK